jgi:hypothetical protein
MATNTTVGNNRCRGDRSLDFLGLVSRFGTAVAIVVVVDVVLQTGSRRIGFSFWTMGTRKGARPFTAVSAVATVTAVVVVVAADFVAAVVAATTTTTTTTTTTPTTTTTTTTVDQDNNI